MEYRGQMPVKVVATSGMPQKSLLGSLLFVLFINDIVANLKHDVLLYSDDIRREIFQLVRKNLNDFLGDSEDTD